MFTVYSHKNFKAPEAKGCPDCPFGMKPERLLLNPPSPLYLSLDQLVQFLHFEKLFNGSCEVVVDNAKTCFDAILLFLGKAQSDSCRCGCQHKLMPEEDKECAAECLPAEKETMVQRTYFSPSVKHVFHCKLVV